MNLTTTTHAAEMVTLPAAPHIFGLPRSTLYRLASEGKIRMVKIASRTLVDAASVRAFLATLPAVQLRQDPRRRSA